VRVYAQVCVSVSLSAGRDNPLMQVRSSLASSSRRLTAALLPAYCGKTAFSTLEVLPRGEGLKLIIVTLAWEDAADAPDALACACDKRVQLLACAHSAISYAMDGRMDDDDFEKLPVSRKRSGTRRIDETPPVVALRVT